MRIIYTLFAAFAVCTFAHAQVIIGAESAPLIGDSWATYNVIIPSAQFPVPTVGTETAYDFSAVGDLEDEDYELAVKDIPLDSIARLDILAVPAGTSEPAFENLPASAILSSFIFPELDDNGNEFALNNVLDVNDTAVFTLVEADLNFFTGGVDLVPLAEPELVFTFGREFGASTTTTSSTVEDDVDFNSQDSTFVTETKTYAGYGSLNTWFADYDEVAVYQTVSELRFYTRTLGSTDPFTIASVQITVTYDFIRPGSFAPVVSYFYDTFDRDNLTVPESVNFTYSQPLNLTDATYVDTELLRLSAAPNPATEAVNVAFEQPATGSVRLGLYDASGREVLRRNLGELPAGSQRIPVALPEALPVGTYFLRLSSGVSTAAIPLIIE